MLCPDKVDNLLGMKLDLNGVWYLRECDISMIKAVPFLCQKQECAIRPLFPAVKAQVKFISFYQGLLMLEMEKLLRLFIPLNVFGPGNFLGQFSCL